MSPDLRVSFPKSSRDAGSPGDIEFRLHFSTEKIQGALTSTKLLLESSLLVIFPHIPIPVASNVWYFIYLHSMEFPGSLNRS